MRRKRKADPDRASVVAAFRRTAGIVDAAQRALLEAIPTARHPGIPLGDAVDEFARLLDEAAETMEAWRRPELVHEWTSCGESLDRARALAARLRAETLDFEALNARVGETIAPLDAFIEVAEGLR